MTWEVRSHVAASLRALTLPRTVACGEQERRIAAVVGLIQRRALGGGRERGRGEPKVSEAESHSRCAQVTPSGAAASLTADRHVCSPPRCAP